MGRVLRAEGQHGQAVALKLLRRELLVPDFLARFAREAEALSRLDHPGIARLLDSGVESTPAGSQPWLALEFVEGAPLGQWVGTSRSLIARLELVAQLCDAVEHAHARGVVHRDLKPENVLVGGDDRPRLLDFGIARFMDASLSSTVALTRPAVLLGTVRYMSPEQAEGRSSEVGPRSDLYSLAVLTYELLTGRLPYNLSAKSIQSALATVIAAEPGPMPEVPVRLRTGLERVLGRALRKSPEDRHPSVAEFAEDLRRVMAGKKPVAPRVRPRTRVPVGLRFRAGLAVTAAIAAAIIFPLRHRHPDPSSLWPRLDAALTRAETMIHTDKRTRAGLLEAIATLEAARRDLSTLPLQPWSPEVRRMIAFLAGEAGLFLGRYDMDPVRLHEAELSFKVAMSPHRLLPARFALPDSSGEWSPGLFQLTTVTAIGSRGHAWTEIAHYEGPASALRQAQSLRLGALRLSGELLALARMAGPADSVAPRSVEYSYRLNEYAESCVELAEVNDSLALVEEALGNLQSAVPLARGVVSPSAFASIQHNLGCAYLGRARLTRRADDLDSAGTRLNAALGWRLTRPNSLVRNDTFRVLARLALIRAEHVRDRRARVKSLDDARVVLERAWADVPSDAHPLNRTMLELSLAELQLRLAETSGRREWLARADSLLTRPSWVPKRDREPVIFAAHQRVLALADVVGIRCFELTDRIVGLREHTRSALYAVPREENPRMARELAGWVAEASSKASGRAQRAVRASDTDSPD